MRFFLLSVVIFAYLICTCFAERPQLNNILVKANPNNTCEAKYSCAEEGDTCQTTNKCKLENGTCCSVGLLCNNGTCASDNVGDSCSSATECFSDYSFSPYGTTLGCVNKTCTVLYLAGDMCEYDSDCLSGNCGNKSTCVGRQSGESCKPGECAYGFYCSGSKCKAQSYNGGSCSSTLQCASGYVCSLSTSKCIEPFTLNSGDACTSGSTEECSEGLLCNNSKCADGSDWDKTSCDDDSDCDQGQECLCSLSSGEQICLPKGLAFSNYTNGIEDQADFLKCVRSNNCTSISTAPNSCTQQECSSDYSDSIDTNCDVYNAIFDSCYSNSDCGGFPLWAIIVIAVVAVILVLVVIVVIVMVVRKNQSSEYDRIE